jgi:two-component system response regulator AtoC
MSTLMEQKPVILVVDDDSLTRIFLKELLEPNGYRVHEARAREEAARKLKDNNYDLIITDLRLEGASGMDVLQEAIRQPYSPEVVLVTAYGSIESSVEAIKGGAFDYLTKPFDTTRVLITLQHALEKKRLKQQFASPRDKLEERYSEKRIIAESAQMRQILGLVGSIRMTRSTVLIQGESGTGKELIAQAIHYSGPRADKPFIAVNCAALPEALLESELFGHVKGAFTGALQDRKGLVEEANGGTLLLDEIGDMPPPIQPKLLRVLEEGKIRKVGSNTMRSVDVRVIAASNRPLEGLVEEGRFRDDLFFRLYVIPITIPPLRERIEDILPLANHFLGMYCKIMHKEIRGFAPEAIDILMNHELRGNVRELENMIERAVAIGCSPYLEATDLISAAPSRNNRQGRSISGAQDRPLSRVSKRLEKKQNMVEKEHILSVLKKSSWNRSRTARELGIGRTTLWSKMKKYGIERPI